MKIIQRVKNYLVANRQTFKVLLIAILISLVYLFTKGYSFGSGNHTEILIAQFRDRDSSYLINDIYLNNGGFDLVRGMFIKFMNFQHLVLGIADKYLFFVNFFITLTLTVLASFLLCSLISRKIVLSAVILLVALLLPEFDLGGVYLIAGQLLPVSFMIPLGLFAIYFAIKKRYAISALLLGVGTLFHLLVGVIFFFVVLFVVASNIIDFKELSAGFKEIKKLLGVLMSYIKKILPFAGIYLLIAAPLLVMTLLELNQKNNIDPELVREIILNVRLPHHYSPSYFPDKEVITFFGWQTLAILILLFNRSFPIRKQLLAIFLSTNLLFFAGYLFVEVIPVNLVLKLQLYRISFLNVLFIKFILLYKLWDILSSFKFMKPKFIQKLKPKHLEKIFFLLLAMYILFLGLTRAQTSLKFENLYNNDKNKVTYNWIKENTPKDSLFITPPNLDDFRLGANRAIVGDFKSFTFSENGMELWYERLKDLCGFAKPDCSGFSCNAYCRKKYADYGNNEFKVLNDKYNVDYILTYQASDLELELVYEENGFKIYKL